MEIAVDGALVGGRPTGPLRLTFGACAPLALAPLSAAPGTRRFALPAFANAHSHLDLTAIVGDLPRRNFTAWIEALVAARRKVQESSGFAPGIGAAIEQLLACGCSAVGDIDSDGSAWQLLAASPLEGVAYREWLGAPSLERQSAATASVVAEARSAPPRWRRGISPHAPYSTTPDCFRAAFAAARAHGLPIASHVGESCEEVELLRSSSGPLQQLFARWQVPVPRWREGGGGPLAALAELGPPRGFVVIHGNELGAADLERCGREGWPLVHCPRSHAWFGHARPALAAAARAGVVLALGTDSRASNEGLDLWAELGCWRAAERELDDAALFAAATRGGRHALQLPPADLAVGDRATFQLVRWRDGSCRDPADLVAAAVRGELETVALVIEGEVAWRAPAFAP